MFLQRLSVWQVDNSNFSPVVLSVVRKNYMYRFAKHKTGGESACIVPARLAQFWAVNTVETYHDRAIPIIHRGDGQRVPIPNRENNARPCLCEGGEQNKQESEQNFWHAFFLQRRKTKKKPRMARGCGYSRLACRICGSGMSGVSLLRIRQTYRSVRR